MNRDDIKFYRGFVITLKKHTKYTHTTYQWNYTKRYTFESITKILKENKRLPIILQKVFSGDDHVMGYGQQNLLKEFIIYDLTSYKFKKAMKKNPELWEFYLYD